jgi:hypothetical protein
MKVSDPSFFHRLYGSRQPRVTYSERDFLDYLLMIALSALVVWVSYRPFRVMAVGGLALCALMLPLFVIRHGLEFRVPAIARKPQDLLYMFVYKLQNARPMYFMALGLLALENVLIAATPGLPHHVDLMRTAAVALLLIHFTSITLFRTVILIDHLAKKELVREVLMQTPWRRVINQETNITLEIVHAYCTGLLSHILLIAPWYLVITHASFSLVFLPVACALDIAVQLKWVKAYNAWFYRDHWVGHNSELEFIFLHGTHHDAIPSALIAVADSGFLEGFIRFALSSPVAFYSPVIAFLIYMFDVKSDIEMHQYIPGVFPRLSRGILEVFQHSTHHYGRLEPYGLAMKLDQPGISEEYKQRFALFPDEMTNSFKLEEELTGLQWDNPTHLSTLRLWDRYQKRPQTLPASPGQQ